MLAQNKSAICFYDDLNVTVQTVSEDEAVVNEIKRVGVIIDRNAKLCLRFADKLIVYLSMGGFPK